jgi:rubrerythrin
MSQTNVNALTEAIDLAMQAEKDAAAFYHAAAASSADPRGKDMFRQLARFEGHHYASLQRMRAGLELGDFTGYQGPELVPEKPAPAGRPLTDAERQTDLDAVNLAIAAEKKARQAYVDLATKATDEAAKLIFERMAGEKALHCKVLEDQFYALANTGHWTWGE